MRTSNPSFASKKGIWDILEQLQVLLGIWDGDWMLGFYELCTRSPRDELGMLREALGESAGEGDGEHSRRAQSEGSVLGCSS